MGWAEGAPVLLPYTPNSVSCAGASFLCPLWGQGFCVCVSVRRALLPSSLFLQMQVEGRSIDFVKHNARSAKRALLRRSLSEQALAELLQQKHREQEDYNTKQKGHVPQ